MSRMGLAGFLVAALSVVFTCATPGGTGVADADIRGTITKIHRAGAEDEGRFIGTVFVERGEETGRGPDKANLIVTDETRIYEQRDGERRRATFDELKVGDEVEARFVEGPTIMIYPLQVGASEIVILDRARAKER